MKVKNRYYVHKLDGKVTRLAMIGEVNGEYGAYAYMDGKWAYMPGLFKIENDVTADFDAISEAEAKEIMEEMGRAE